METSPFHDMPDLIPFCQSTGTNTPVLQPEGDEGVHDFTQEDFDLYAWFESRYVYSMHSLFHHYVTNCHFTGIIQIEPFRLTFQVTPSIGVELMSEIRPGCLITDINSSPKGRGVKVPITFLLKKVTFLLNFEA